MKNLLLLLTLFAFLACDNGNDDPTVYRVGDTIDLRGSDNLELFSVLEGRCPCEVTCGFPGSALATLVNGLDTVRLHTYGEMTEANYRGNRIKMLDVAPFPCPSEVVPQTDYRVTLQVER